MLAKLARPECCQRHIFHPGGPSVCGKVGKAGWQRLGTRQCSTQQGRRWRSTGALVTGALVTGARTKFLPAASSKIDCRALIPQATSGHIASVWIVKPDDRQRSG